MKSLPTLVESPRLRLLTLCALYAAQGIPWGFVTITLAAFLAEHDVPAGEVGNLVALATLPWSLKFVWGPIIDRYGWWHLGRRRPWILLAQAMMSLTLLVMVFLGDLTTSVVAVSWMAFVHNVFNSLQDVAVDALAVDLLTEDERGRANGFMWGAKFLGIAIGGALMATVMESFGLRLALLLQVILLFLIMMLPLWLRERPSEGLFPWSKGTAESSGGERDSDISQTWVLLRRLRRAFSLRSTILAAFFAVGAMGVPAMTTTFTTTLLTSELNWTTAEVAHLTGGWGVAFGVGGALLGGLLADRLGAKRLGVIGILLSAVLLIVFGLLESQWNHRAFIYAVILAVSGINAVVQVGLFSLYMKLSWPVVAATQFTAYMTLLNVGMTLGPKAVGPVEGALGYAGGFVAMGIVHAATLLFLVGIDPGETRRVLGDGETLDDEPLPA